MPHPKPKNTKPKAINPSFHPKKRNCPFCSFYGAEENFNKHIAQKKRCNKDWAVARHQVHLDVGVIDGQGLLTVPNTHSSSPTKANRTLVKQNNSQQFDRADDSSFQNHLGDVSHQGEHFGDDNIHVVITRLSDDQSMYSCEDSDNVDEFPLQLLQELSIEEPIVDDSVAPLMFLRALVVLKFPRLLIKVDFPKLWFGQLTAMKCSSIYLSMTSNMGSAFMCTKEEGIEVGNAYKQSAL
jgi:hypothetical protein